VARIPARCRIGGVLAVTPWHRAQTYDFLLYVFATGMVCASLFAWLVLARDRRSGIVVASVQLALLAVFYAASQWLLSGPVRPPVADWALFTAATTGVVCMVAAVIERRHVRWPRAAGASVLVLVSWLAAAGSFNIAFGDGAESSAKVEPYLAEVDPGWGYRVTDHRFGGGSGGVYFLTATVTGNGDLDPRDFGWRSECAPVGGLLARLGLMHWGAHCLTVAGSTVQVEVRSGRLPDRPLVYLCCPEWRRRNRLLGPQRLPRTLARRHRRMDTSH
jgi:hypothetical protein